MRRRCCGTRTWPCTWPSGAARRYEYYDAAYDENTVRKLAIGGELRSAIAGDQLELHFQPQVNLRSGLVESCRGAGALDASHAGRDQPRRSSSPSPKPPT